MRFPEPEEDSIWCVSCIKAWVWSLWMECMFCPQLQWERIVLNEYLWIEKQSHWACGSLSISHILLWFFAYTNDKWPLSNRIKLSRFMTKELFKVEVLLLTCVWGWLKTCLVLGSSPCSDQRNSIHLPVLDEVIKSKTKYRMSIDHKQYLLHHCWVDFGFFIQNSFCVETK